MVAVDPAEARRQRGMAIAATTRITQKHGVWNVPSQKGNGSYKVHLNPANPTVPLCTCPDYMERGEPCKHVYAVRYVVERERHADGSETTTETVMLSRKTVAERPTYPQDWVNYNLAQVNEKPMLASLLADLCAGIADPPRKPGPGRNRLHLSDMIFAAVYKVFGTLSARRSMGDLADAHAKGYIAKVPHFNSISKTLELPYVAMILRALIAESARPLKAIETKFAVDSSGFSTSRFIRWFDHKYGCPRQEYDWVKCSVMTGVKTNVITSVEIDERYAGDCPRFKPLVETTARDFSIGEVSADAAYCSYDNHELVAKLGGVPYIAFARSATGAKGGLYEKMFHLYSFRRDEFLNHFHLRSNVESTFSMVKRKFGDFVRSKTDVAMGNEVLAKILCHNICCLIASTYELGITPVFWGPDELASAPEPEPALTAVAAVAPGATDFDESMTIYDWI